MNLQLTSGDLKATGIVSGGMTAHATSGTIRLEGRFTGENKISNVSGDIHLNAVGSIRDYSRSVSVLSGSVYVNGSKVSGNDTNPAVSNRLDISIISGTARIQFTDDM
jgi:DUF4097 and DUF4098 domain-containing protein YvlB